MKVLLSEERLPDLLHKTGARLLAIPCIDKKFELHMIDDRQATSAVDVVSE